ncbi:MAG TPA: ABC transporter permease subunit [Longimicrobiales bacterium]
MRNMLRLLFVRYRVFLLLVSLLLGLFQFLLCAVVASMNLESALEQVLMFAPPAMRAIIEQSVLGGSAAGVLAFGWNHPITHALLAAIAIALASRAIAGEAESGVIELVLAQPITRARYLATHVLFGVAALTLVAAVGVIGTAVGQRVFGLSVFPVLRLFELLAAMVLLQLAIYGGALLLSAYGREAGRVAGLAVWLALVSYFLSVIATLWSKAAFLRPYSLHSYYDPRAILVDGRLAFSLLAVLGTISVLTTALAFARFRTRDLP